MNVKVSWILSLIMTFTFFNTYSQSNVNIDELTKRLNLYYYNNDTIPFSGTAVSYYSNMKIKSKFVIDRGTCISYKKFSDSGNLLLIEKYDRNGKRNGAFLTLNNEGDTLQSGNYVKDEKNGWWIELENNILKKGKYYKDKKIGLWIFSENGKIIKRIKY